VLLSVLLFFSVVKLMKRYQKGVDVLEAFTLREWFFTQNNFVSITDDQVGNDKSTFSCDVRGIIWEDVIHNNFFAARKVFLKENDADIKGAKTRMMW